MRTIQEIEQDYTQVCAKAGHLQYQINQLTKELEKINYKLFALNEEANTVSKQGEKTNE